MAINLTVNGQSTPVDVPPDTPLLWVIRDVLNLHGTKYGCGIGQCGACTVHLGGKPVRSCLTPRLRRGKRADHTIEGLSPDGSHPLQQAWLEVDVPQCGYCQAGQIMSAAALLAKHPNPTDQEIDDGHERQSVPMRNISAHPAGDPQGRFAARERIDSARRSSWRRIRQRTRRSVSMRLSRRSFLHVTALSGGGMLLGMYHRAENLGAATASPAAART